MNFSRVHVVGAGLAGLSAATVLAEAGAQVVLYEAGPVAGGRARSYFDKALGCRVDNGNHLLLSGNRAVMQYLSRMGARETLVSPDAPEFPFMDLESGERWVLRPNLGRVPWWIFSPARRVPGTSLLEYLSLMSLGMIGDERSVAQALRAGPLRRRLLEPLAIAALNTPPEEALARLLGAVVNETLALGGAACVPCIPREGLSETFVDPAIGWLREQGAEMSFSRRVVALDLAANEVRGLRDGAGAVAIGRDEAVLLAVPPWIAGELLPGLTVPDEFQAIVNVHYRVDVAAGMPTFIGLVGGTAEWVFSKPHVDGCHVSVTISAANRLVDEPAEDLAARCWPEVRRALNLSEEMPNWRVVKERRATFAATPAQERRRPAARSGMANLALAGDWTATGLPATIEGAIRSGRAAAEVLLRPS